MFEEFIGSILSEQIIAMFMHLGDAWDRLIRSAPHNDLLVKPIHAAFGGRPADIGEGIPPRMAPWLQH